MNGFISAAPNLHISLHLLIDVFAVTKSSFAASDPLFLLFQALLLTVDRVQREMKELDSARDSLMNLCTAGGRDALALEVSHLHELCSNSEQELRQHLLACEVALRELDGRLAGRNQAVKERAAAIQWELRSLDQALGCSEPQNTMDGLQRLWNSLQVTQTSNILSQK